MAPSTTNGNIAGSPYVIPKVDKLAQATHEHAQVQQFHTQFAEAFADFPGYLKGELIENCLTLHIPGQKPLIGENIFSRLEPLPLLDKYQAYQLLADQWQEIAIDLEILQTEGFEASRVVDPNMVMKKKKGKDVEVQEGWKGRIMPFELVQTVHLTDQLNALNEKENRLSEVSSSIKGVIESLSEAEGEYDVLNDANDKFAAAELNGTLKDLLSDIETDDIKALKAYVALLDAKAKKTEKEAFIAEYPDVQWSQMEANKDGTYAKGKVNSYIVQLQSAFEFPEDSFASKLIKAAALLSEEKELKAAIKQEAEALHLLTKETIEGLSDTQVNELLERKWITPLNDDLHRLAEQEIDSLTSQLQALVEKYQITYADNAREIQQTETELAGMLDELDGNDFDLKGLAELKTFLVSN